LTVKIIPITPEYREGWENTFGKGQSMTTIYASPEWNLLDEVKRTNPHDWVHDELKCVWAENG